MVKNQKKYLTKRNILFLYSTVIGVFVLSLAFSACALAAEAAESTIQEGKKLTLDFCQACHKYEGTEQAGTVAPPLVSMKSRFPDRKKLYDIIYNPQSALKPQTMMPPFGQNYLLSKEEIEKIIDFLYSL